jgi:7-carboxy-7-deazaguanine synthase
MSLDEVMEEVRKLGCELVEITGGEPLAQGEAFELIRRLCDEGFEVLIETSGSIDTSPVDPRAKIILDVKCPGSGEMEKNHWPNLERLRENDEVKFVIADRRDYEWAREIVAARELGRWIVLFSPAWDQLDLKLLAEWMLEDRLPARLQTQLHKHIWGADVHGV